MTKLKIFCQCTYIVPKALLVNINNVDDDNMEVAYMKLAVAILINSNKAVSLLYAHGLVLD